MTRLQQVLMVIAIAVVAIYFFLNKVYDPLSARLKDIIAENNKVVQTVNTLKNQPVSTASIEASIDKLLPELRKTEEHLKIQKSSVLTPTDKIEETVMQVSAVAANNGLLVQDLTPATMDESNLAAEMLQEIALLERTCYRLKIVGDFLDFYAFSKELETVDYLINIAGLSVTGSDASGRVVADLVLVF
jgi:hypothetical protein